MEFKEQQRSLKLNYEKKVKENADKKEQNSTKVVAEERKRLENHYNEKVLELEKDFSQKLQQEKRKLNSSKDSFEQEQQRIWEKDRQEARRKIEHLDITRSGVFTISNVTIESGICLASRALPVPLSAIQISPDCSAVWGSGTCHVQSYESWLDHAFLASQISRLYCNV